MKRFLLNRIEDESGISGKGIIAEGVLFSEGRCVLVWLTTQKSVGIYDSYDDMIKIHGHGGKTIVVWVDN